MRRSLRIAVLIALAAVTPGLAACEQASWKMADKSLAAVARDVAGHAASSDVGYFRGLTPDRQAVPDIIRQIARSGIATNYADHLIVATPGSATLAYSLRGDDTTATSLAIELSLVDGEVRVDQIFTHGTEKIVGSPGAPSEAIVSSEVIPSEIGSISVAVSIAPDKVRGYGLQSALIGYTNTSSEATIVPVPLDVFFRITDSQNRLVSEGFEPTDTLQPTNPEFLPPWATIYDSVRFVAPQPGRYTLRGRANGVWSSAVEFETTR